MLLLCFCNHNVNADLMCTPFFLASCICMTVLHGLDVYLKQSLSQEISNASSGLGHHSYKESDLYRKHLHNIEQSQTNYISHLPVYDQAMENKNQLGCQTSAKKQTYLPQPVSSPSIDLSGNQISHSRQSSFTAKQSHVTPSQQNSITLPTRPVQYPPPLQKSISSSQSIYNSQIHASHTNPHNSSDNISMSIPSYPSPLINRRVANSTHHQLSTQPTATSYSTNSYEDGSQPLIIHTRQASVSNQMEYQYPQRAHSPSVSMVQGPVSPSFPGYRTTNSPDVSPSGQKPHHLVPSRIPPPPLTQQQPITSMYSEKAGSVMSPITSQICESRGNESPPITPPTPIVCDGELEDEFTRVSA